MSAEPVVTYWTPKKHVKSCCNMRPALVLTEFCDKSKVFHIECNACGRHGFKNSIENYASQYWDEGLYFETMTPNKKHMRMAATLFCGVRYGKVPEQ